MSDNSWKLYRFEPRDMVPADVDNSITKNLYISFTMRHFRSNSGIGLREMIGKIRSANLVSLDPRSPIRGGVGKFPKTKDYDFFDYDFFTPCRHCLR